MADPTANWKNLTRDDGEIYSFASGDFPKSSMPFVVVAGDGTGDFTTIAAAIASLPAGASNISQLIFVKQFATGYDDSAGTIDFAGKNVTIMGEESDYKTDGQSGTNEAPTWKLNASGLTNSLGGNAVRLINMKITMASGQLCGTAGSGMNIEAEHCDLPDIYGSGGTVNVVMRWCKFGTLFTQSMTFAPTLTTVESSLGTALNAVSVTVTWNGSTTLRLHKVQFTSSANGAFTVASGSTGTYFVFDEVQSSGASTLTFNTLRTDNRVQITNCINFPSVTFAIGSSGGCDIVMAGNTMPSATVTLTEAAGNQSESVYIDGEYAAINLACSASTVNAMLNGRGSTGRTLLTLSGNNNIACVGCIPGTTTTGVNVSGNNNIILAPNISSCTTPSSNTGTGNSINGLPPGGTAGGDLAGTYPNPTIKASVGLTGSPTAPTQTAQDNSTKIATTAYVDQSEAGRILAQTVYEPAVLATYALTITSKTKLDTTNLTLTFTVPPSGKVDVEVTAPVRALPTAANVDQAVFLQLVDHGTTTQRGNDQRSWEVQTSATSASLTVASHVIFHLTGLTPGASMTEDLAGFCATVTNASAAVFAGGGASGMGAITMRAVAA